MINNGPGRSGHSGMVQTAKGDDMEYRNRHFAYNCKCGYSVNVFIDFGRPQEYLRCRACGNMVQRRDFD